MQRSSSSFVERIIGAIRLAPGTYEEVEHDTDATWQAAVVVAAAAILTGVGSSGGRTQNLLSGVVASVVFWALFALFAYLVGVHILKGPQTSATFGEVLRVIGLRQSLEVSTGRAVAVAVVAFLAMVVVLVIIASVFGLSIVAIDSLTRRT